MKIYILLLLIAFVYLTANAQERPSLRGYEKWVDGGVTFSVNYDLGYGVKFTNGYRFNNHIFLGAGFALDHFLDLSIIIFHFQKNIV